MLPEPGLNGGGLLSDDGHRGHAMLEVLRAVFRKGAELAPAVRSPGAAVESEQHRTVPEELVQRVDHAA